MEGFKIEERETVTDKKSVERALSRPLRLLVKRSYGSEKPFWELPTAVHENGETLRDTAERALKEAGVINAQVLGNAPFGFYKYAYSKRVRAEVGHRGRKVFIFKALFEAKGEVKAEEEFWWALREEMEQALDVKAIGAINQFVPTEME